MQARNKKFIDLTGKRYGRYLVIKDAGGDPAKWLCKCDCGKEKIVWGKSLKNGDVVSCGCYARETTKTRIKHGARNTPEYYIWTSMKQRCLNPKSKPYADYGGRGITVCDRWLVFENFISDMGSRPEGKSLDRIDNNAGYSPENCRWADQTTQKRNTRANKKFVYNGSLLTIAEIAGQIGMKPDTLKHRIAKGMSIDVAIRTFGRGR